MAKECFIIAGLWWLFASILTASPDIGVRAQSFGGAYRAVASSNDTIFYNPAGMIKYRRIGSDFDYKVATDKGGYQRLGVSVLDSSTTAWGLGLAYNANINAMTDIPTSHLLHLALAMPIVTDMFVLGTSVSYLYNRSPALEPYKHFFNMDVGLMTNLPMGVSFAVVVDHILAPKGEEKALGLSLAAACDFQEVAEKLPLTVSFDWLVDNLKTDGDLGHSIGFGAEYLAFSVMPLRLGFKSELNNRDNLLSMGTGLTLSGFSLDGLYQQHLSMGKIRQFGVAVRFVF